MQRTQGFFFHIDTPCLTPFSPPHPGPVQVSCTLTHAFPLTLRSPSLPRQVQVFHFPSPPRLTRTTMRSRYLSQSLASCFMGNCPKAGTPGPLQDMGPFFVTPSGLAYFSAPPPLLAVHPPAHQGRVSALTLGVSQVHSVISTGRAVFVLPLLCSRNLPPHLHIHLQGPWPSHRFVSMHPDSTAQ